MKIDELMQRARAVDLRNPAAVDLRNLEIVRLCDADTFPALMSMVLEFEDDMARSVADYNRTPEERAMDAGGLATMRKFRETIEGLLMPKPEEPKAPEPIGGEKKT